jgi:hypothetical protein
LSSPAYSGEAQHAQSSTLFGWIIREVVFRRPFEIWMTLSQRRATKLASRAFLGAVASADEHDEIDASIEAGVALSFEP